LPLILFSTSDLNCSLFRDAAIVVGFLENFSSATLTSYAISVVFIWSINSYPYP